MTRTEKLDDALVAWRGALGQEHVITERGALSQAESTTFSTHQKVLGILRPASTAEVQACVRIAAKFGVPVYAVSRGRNWGYGSRVPSGDGSVLIELARMDRIREFSEELAYIRVEPGVTSGQIRDFLLQQKSRLWAPKTASGWGISSLGNLLDRGFSTASSGPNENRVANVCSLEVVLADGSHLVTGLGRYENAAAANVDNWAVGPQLDGLFAQGNLGIVTAATLWLAPRPRHVEIGIGAVRSQDLAEVVERLRGLRLEVAPRARFILSSRYRIAAIAGQYPWEETRGATPIPQGLLERETGLLAGLPRLSTGGDWTLQIFISGASRAQLSAEKDLVKEALEKVVRRFVFVDFATIEGIESLGKIIQKGRRWWRPGAPPPGEDPPAVANQLYWRKRGKWPADFDPDRDRCGCIWWVPMMPWTGTKVRAVVDLTERIARAHGLEPNMSLRFPTDRSTLVICSLAFDRDLPGEDERAMGCYEELVRRCAEEEGCYPYRLGLQGTDVLPPAEPGFGSFMQRLKTALDPADILSPGRYDFRREWPPREPA